MYAYFAIDFGRQIQFLKPDPFPKISRPRSCLLYVFKSGKLFMARAVLRRFINEFHRRARARTHKRTRARNIPSIRNSFMSYITKSPAERRRSSMRELDRRDLLPHTSFGLGVVHIYQGAPFPVNLIRCLLLDPSRWRIRSAARVTCIFFSMSTSLQLLAPRREYKFFAPPPYQALYTILVHISSSSHFYYYLCMVFFFYTVVFYCAGSRALNDTRPQ